MANPKDASTTPIITNTVRSILEEKIRGLSRHIKRMTTLFASRRIRKFKIWEEFKIREEIDKRNRIRQP